MIPRLKDKYKKEIIQNLMSKLNYKNINAVPKIEKIVINMGLGQEGLDKKKMEICVKDISWYFHFKLLVSLNGHHLNMIC